jgi:iron complex transport system substrate-binding protein
MKIVSLLPSATEIVYALGMGADLVGVTDECDFPPDAVTKPVVSRSALPQGRPLTSREIDAAVRQRMDAKEALYILDKDLLRRERPDVILTQDLCRVCAVPSGQVERALDELGLPDAKVVSLDPHTLDDVIAQMDVVGKVLDAQQRAQELTATMRARVARVKEIALRLPTIRVFCLEWSEPAFVAGHWVPEMVEAAGGVNVLSAKGEPSKVVTWRQIRDENPEVIVFMPCGYYLEEAEGEGAALSQQPDFTDTPAARNGNVFAVDATSFFSRPGPRIVDGLEILAWAVHPEAYPEPAAGSITQLR